MNERRKKKRTGCSRWNSLSCGTGTGFSVSSEGHFVSNNHVIYGCNEVQVHNQAETMKVSILATDPVNDLALLKTELTGQKFLTISRNNPELLEEIYVAGFPLGVELALL